MIPYQRKLLPDGTPNPKYKKDTRPRRGGKSGKSGKSGRRLSNFDRGEFIAFDGEGGEVAGVHQYLMLMSSDGHSITNPKGLTSEQCFKFLIEQRRAHKDGIFVIFAGGYDGNLWLRDIPKETIELIVSASYDAWVYWGDWGIRFKQRKYFALTHRTMTDEKGKPLTMIVWDVHGFFQSSFVAACKTWIPDYAKLELIIEGKKKRTAFTANDAEFMNAYTSAELDALVLIMLKLRDACKALDLKLNRWDGAGAVAAAIYKIHDVKDAICEPPPDVYDASKHAYFGGRIEMIKYGRHTGKIHHYDINSAYPDKQRQLPSLAGGTWKRYRGNIDVREFKELLVISEVKWDISENHLICPFPLRSEMQNKVLYPTEGWGWYWKPEVCAALDEQDAQAGKPGYFEIEIIETFVFYPANDHKPFDFINTYYEQRKAIVAESKRTGIPNGVEKAIKLGINSLYGKLAQRVGYNPETGRIPPYHQLCYAGYITSATRAQLYRAACQAPHAIICMATDGIYSTEPLTLDCPKDKILGAWEYQQHDGMTMIQSGVYFLDDGGELSSYSRGFDKMTTQDGMRETLDVILKAWANRKPNVSLPCTRFITLKSALCGGDWWSRWLTWYEFVQPDGTKGRVLKIHPEGTKRTLCDKRTRADKYMLQTKPTENLFPDFISAPHDIPWDDADNFLNDIELESEHAIESID